MATHTFIVVGLLAFSWACGGQPEPARTLAEPVAIESEARPVQRSPDLLWWQGAEPVCASGLLKRRELSWGAVFWCASTGQRADQNLQNDLGKLARCVSESVNAFQEEPGSDGLGDFLARAHESGLNPTLCSAVRRDSEVRTYHGRRVLMERRVLSEDEHELNLLYRFGCEECVVAAEATVSVAAP